MENFEQQLLRLKQVLKVTSDQDVAAALGLSKAAFSDRKRRGAFPEERLFALATKRPDLHLDVLYVLAGDRKDAAMRLTFAELEAALVLGADKGGTPAEQFSRAAAMVEEMHRQLPDDERVLLESYRRCTQEAKAQLIQTAALLSAGLPTASPKTPRKPGVSQKAVGDNAIQIGGVTGKAKIKNK